MTTTAFLTSSNQEDDATPILENNVSENLFTRRNLFFYNLQLSTTASPVAVNLDDPLSAAEGTLQYDVVVGYSPTASYCVLLNSSVNSASPTNRSRSYNGLFAYVGCILFVLVVYAVLRFISAYMKHKK